jgi:Na+/H+ antiporter NhaD/arsenite permease-like protein
VLAAALIFLGTYLVLALGRLPGFRVDRTGAAIIGASLMMAFEVLTLEEAWAAVDHNTILLLFGMMIVAANLRVSGVFAAVSAWSVEHARHPLTLLAAVILVSGVFSAFFVNDTVCLVLTPLVLDMALALGRNPVPYLLAVAMGSNIGSVATITGNPQNMLIGAFSGIRYRTFAAALAPVAAVALVLAFLVIALVYRGEFRRAETLAVAPRRTRIHRPLAWKSLTVSALMLIGFFWGWPVAEVAIVAAALLLLTRKLKPERIYREIDFSLLVLFIGLFIVIAGVEKTLMSSDALVRAAGSGLERPIVFSAAAALLSNLVSNVPAVLLFKPLIPTLGDPERGWLLLSMASTLAGNLTLLGSVANLIVVQKAGRKARIGFAEYFRTGLPLTLLTMAAGMWLLR